MTVTRSCFIMGLFHINIYQGLLIGKRLYYGRDKDQNKAAIIQYTGICKYAERSYEQVEEKSVKKESLEGRRIASAQVSRMERGFR